MRNLSIMSEFLESHGCVAAKHSHWCNSVRFCILYVRPQWVDDVLIDAPYVITEEMVQSLRISVVVCGTPARTSRRHRSFSSANSRNHSSSSGGGGAGAGTGGFCTSSDSSDNDECVSSGYGQRHLPTRRAVGSREALGTLSLLQMMCNSLLLCTGDAIFFVWLFLFCVLIYSTRNILLFNYLINKMSTLG